jgi:hypothetical protein
MTIDPKHQLVLDLHAAALAGERVQAWRRDSTDVYLLACVGLVNVIDGRLTLTAKGEAEARASLYERDASDPQP